MTGAAPTDVEVPVDRNAYGTPTYVIEAVRAAMGGITLDPASNLDAQARVQAERWCGPDHPDTDMHNGQQVSWDGERVFLNPPYGRGLVAPFVSHLAKSNPLAWCVLTNLVGSTKWSRLLRGLSVGIVMVDHRVAFLHPFTGLPCKGNDHDQVLTFGGAIDPAPLAQLGTVLLTLNLPKR